MESAELKARALAAARISRMLKLRQVDIAAATGVHQSQVSRVLRGHYTRSTAAFNAVCTYVQSQAIGSTASAVRRNTELVDAVASVWDGTAGHASALAAVIRSLGALK